MCSACTQLNKQFNGITGHNVRRRITCTIMRHAHIVCNGPEKDAVSVSTLAACAKPSMLSLTARFGRLARMCAAPRHKAELAVRHLWPHQTIELRVQHPLQHNNDVPCAGRSLRGQDVHRYTRLTVRIRSSGGAQFAAGGGQPAADCRVRRWAPQPAGEACRPWQCLALNWRPTGASQSAARRPPTRTQYQ